MRYGHRPGPPSWFIILLGIAIVFGVYYLWMGLRNFMSTGVSASESTLQANEQDTATAIRIEEIEFNAPTLLPSITPVPPCHDFEVSVPIATVRTGPSISSSIVTGLREGTVVCVIALLPDSDWYLVDQNERTRRIEQVYMHRDIIRALNPTPTPTVTLTPTNTLTPTASATPTKTLAPTAAPSQDRRSTTRPPAPAALPSATATAPSISL